MCVEPDEGTYMIWISDLTHELFIEINRILSENNDELEDAEEDNYKYFVDACIETSYEVIKILEENDYIYSD